MRTRFAGYVLRFAILALIICILPSLPAGAQDPQALVVSPDGPFQTIEAALASASTGDVLTVQGGIYNAPLLIDKSVTITGIDNPVIDGHGEGSLVIITAPDVRFQGFTLRSTGRSQNHEDTGIVIQAPRVEVIDNRLESVLFGIYFANAREGLARGNTIQCLDMDLGLRGDGIRVWYSNGVRIERNEVTNCRDTLIWFAENVTIAENFFHHNRYGLHFMYSHDAAIRGNRLEYNSVGAYLMYSHGLTMLENVSAYNRGPSGYGLALKDMDEVSASDNLFIANRAGLYIDNSPALYDGYNHFNGNVFAYNDIGVTTLPAVKRNIFQSNTFLENVQQVSTQGRGDLQGNIWQEAGIGNYWSDYAGYDENGDGIGEMPYRSEKLFESLMDTRPVLRLFLYSPATQALDFAAAAFPTLRPAPKLIDESPMTRYVLPVPASTDPARVSLPLLVISLVLVGLGSGVCVLALRPTISWRVGTARLNTHLKPDQKQGRAL